MVDEVALVIWREFFLIADNGGIGKVKFLVCLR